MMLNFSEEMKRDTLFIANIAKAVEFNSAEIQECKGRNEKMEKEITQLNATNTELTKEVEDTERKEKHQSQSAIKQDGICALTA